MTQVAENGTRVNVVCNDQNWKNKKKKNQEKKERKKIMEDLTCK